MKLILVLAASATGLWAQVDLERPLTDLIRELNRTSSLPIHVVAGEMDARTPVRVDGRPVRVVLDELVSQTQGSYELRPDGVNVLSAAVARDPRHPLRLHLPSFDFEGGTVVEAAFALFSRPELLTANYHILMSGVGVRRDDEPPVRVSLKNTTPLEALNAIAGTTGSFWVLRDGSGIHSLVFYSLETSRRPDTSLSISAGPTQ